MSMACTECKYRFTDGCSRCVDDSEFEDRLSKSGNCDECGAQFVYPESCSDCEEDTHKENQ